MTEWQIDEQGRPFKLYPNGKKYLGHKARCAKCDKEFYTLNGKRGAYCSRECWYGAFEKRSILRDGKKLCVCCNRFRDPTFFSNARLRTKKWVKTNRCLECTRDSHNASNHKHREKLRITKKKYVQNNKDAILDYARNYYYANRDICIERATTRARSFQGYKRVLFHCIKHRLKTAKTYKHRRLEFTLAEFLTWITTQKTYKALHTQWVLSDYKQRLSPTVDRIDNAGHYSLDNIQILPLWLNVSKGTKSSLAWSLSSNVEAEGK